MSETVKDTTKAKARALDIEGRQAILQSGLWRYNPNCCASAGLRLDIDIDALDFWRDIYKSQQEDDLSKCIEKGTHDEISMVAFRYVCQIRYPDAGF